MKVKELVKILKLMDQEALVDIASDEEGNAFGEISPVFAEGKLKSGKKVYSLYPKSLELPTDRYEF